MIVGNSSGAFLSIETIRERLTQGMHPSAGTHSGFEYDDVVSKLRQLITCHQPSHPSAKNYHFLGRASRENCRRCRNQVRPRETNSGSSDCAALQELAASYCQLLPSFFSFRPMRLLPGCLCLRLCFGNRTRRNG